MKIVHLTESLKIGGAEKLISLLCRLQRRQGHDPSVHCLFQMGILGEELRAEGFEVIVHQPPALKIMRTVYRGLKQRAPEVVHCHNATATILGALPARLAGVKSILATRHGLVSPPYSLRRELKFAMASRWCNWIVAVCEQAKQNLCAAPLAARRKVVRVYNAVAPLPAKEARLPEKRGLTLLHVARLSAVKDQATLLRAFALARARMPELRMWIVGDGPLRAELEGAAQDLGIHGSVTFFGEQADPCPFYAAADLFVLSSVTEGIPISLLEALSAGLPAVATDVGGMAEIARLSGAVAVVSPSNPNALADAILQIAQSPAELPRLRDMARQCYLQYFTLERMADEYMRLYQGLPLL